MILTRAPPPECLFPYHEKLTLPVLIYGQTYFAFRLCEHCHNTQKKKKTQTISAANTGHGNINIQLICLI